MVSDELSILERQLAQELRDLGIARRERERAPQERYRLIVDAPVPGSLARFVDEELRLGGPPRSRGQTNRRVERGRWSARERHRRRRGVGGRRLLARRFLLHRPGEARQRRRGCG